MERDAGCRGTDAHPEVGDCSETASDAGTFSGLADPRDEGAADRLGAALADGGDSDQHEKDAEGVCHREQEHRRRLDTLGGDVQSAGPDVIGHGAERDARQDADERRDGKASAHARHTQSDDAGEEQHAPGEIEPAADGGDETGGRQETYRATECVGRHIRLCGARLVSCLHTSLSLLSFESS